MKDQPIYKSPLSILGIILIIGGLLFNIKMFVDNDYPTTLFFILMVCGLAFIVIDIFIRRSRQFSLTSKLFIQVLFIIVPPTGFYLTYEIIFPRAEVIIVNENFSGPYAIIYDIPGYPPIERKGRDLIIKIPENGILITSSERRDAIMVETYRIDTNFSSLYGKEINNQHGGSGSRTSECGSYNFSFGSISKTSTSDLNFNEDKFLLNVSKMLCDKRILNK